MVVIILSHGGVLIPEFFLYTSDSGFGNRIINAALNCNGSKSIETTVFVFGWTVFPFDSLSDKCYAQLHIKTKISTTRKPILAMRLPSCTSTTTITIIVGVHRHFMRLTVAKPFCGIQVYSMLDPAILVHSCWVQLLYLQFPRLFSSQICGEERSLIYTFQLLVFKL